MGTGSVIEFRCWAKIPQQDLSPAQLDQIPTGAVLPLRSCGGRVIAKTYGIEAACPRCGERYAVGDPNTVRALPKTPA